MKLTLQRGIPKGESLPGEMFFGGEHTCYTMERVAVAIPAETYKVGLYPSPHFGRMMPILLDVPGRSDILLHWGNYPENSDGCILVGEEIDLNLGEIFNTVREFAHIFPAIEAAVKSEGCEIEILDSPTTDQHADDL